MRSDRAMRLLNRASLHALAVLASVVFLSPLAWMVSTSAKPAEQLLRPEGGLLPDPPSSTAAHLAANYAAAWGDPIVNFPLALRNSLIVCALSVAGVLVSSSVVAYGFSRLRWPGRDAVFGVVLATMLVPYPVLMGSLYVIFRELGWIGSFRPLWVPLWFGAPFQIFLLRQFFVTIPRELDEAATIDGCSRLGVFLRVILPLSRPALAVVALFTFVFTWNDFLAPLVYLNQQDQFTLALGLQMFQSQLGNTPWNHLMAAATMMTLPVVGLFVLTQRTFVEGIATQGIKG